MGDKFNNIVLEHVQVSPTGEITGKVKEADGLEDTEEYSQLFEQLNSHFNNDQMVSIINYNPNQNELCACKFANQWHRVKVEYILSRKNGQSASCVFVDEGRNESVPVSWLRQLPSKFRSVPFQVKRIFLHDIQPVTMVISEEIMAVQKPVKVWDEAAVKFIHDSFKVASRVRCILIEQHSDTAISVRMYLENDSGSLICLNDMLVRQNYAVNLSDIQEDFSIAQTKPKKTVQDVIRSRQQKQITNMNSSDIDICTKSDTEFTVRSRQESLGFGMVGKGYETDTVGVSALSHRAIHRGLRAGGKPKLVDPWEEDEDEAETVRGQRSTVISRNQCDTMGTDSRDKVRGNRSDAKRYEDLTDEYSQVLRKSGFVSNLSSSEAESSNNVKTCLIGRQHSYDSDSSSQALYTKFHQSSSILPKQHKQYSQCIESSSSISPDYRRGRDSNNSSTSKSVTSLNHGDCNKAPFILGQGSKGFERETFLGQKQYGINQQISDSEMVKTTNNAMPYPSEFYSDGELSTLRKSSSSSKAGVSAIHGMEVGHSLPRYGRGKLLNSSQAPSVIVQSSIHQTCGKKEGLKCNTYQGSGDKSESEMSVSEKSPRSVSTSNITSVTVGRGSPKYGRGALFSSPEPSDASSPKQHIIHRTLDSVNMNKMHMKNDSREGRVSEREISNEPISPRSPSVGINKSSPSLSGTGSPKVGRGTLLNSPETPGIVRPKHCGIEQTYDSGKIENIYNKSINQNPTPSESDASALQKSPGFQSFDTGDKTAGTYGRGLPKFGRGAFLDYLETPGVVRPKQYSIAQGVKDKVGLSGQVSPNRQIYSESDVGQTRITSSVPKTKEASREELVKLGVFDDAFTETEVKTRNVNNNNMSRFLKSPDQTNSAAKNLCTNRGDYSSGCESSTSSASVVAASVFGQREFKKSRLPKVALGKSSEDTAGLRQSGETRKRSPSKTELQTLIKQMSDKTNPDRVERDRVPESILTENKKVEMMGKLTGQKLLESLGSGSRPSGSQISNLKSKEVMKGMFGAADGVIVHGTRPPNPFKSFSDTTNHFTQHVKQHLENEDFAAPTLVQAYTWPAIIRGRHVVTIAPPDTGKTLAYLYPIISGMSEARIYQELPLGNGPLTIIVTYSWRKAEEVYYHTCQVVANRSGLRVVLVHGGGEEDKKACTLINGCEVLVVTAPSLKRLLESGYTEVRRLCHLIIDDGDQVLQTFGKEISHLVEEYLKVISGEMKHLKCPRQILLMGSQWNKATELFLTHFLCEPVLIITSSFEGSIYGRVKHITHMCRPDDRMKEVLGILGNVVNDSNKTIVFATRKEDIINIFQIARNCSHYCLMLHQEMELSQVEHIVHEWHQNLSLLICCDAYVSDLKITNATTVIHFDMPNSKTKFSNRLGCMRQFFFDFSDPDKKRVAEPTSHLVITENCRYNRLGHVVEMLQRTSNKVPSRLKELLQECQDERNRDEDRGLCEQILAFGSCRDKWRCPDRHRVMPEVDVSEHSAWVPNEGEVKVLVSHVMDASHYYVRLLSVRYENGLKKDLSLKYSSLQMDIALWYSNLKNQKRKTAPYVGEVCGYQENEMFYRVQIVEFLDMNCKREREKGPAPIEALVRFVDTGRMEEVPAFKMYELPEHLKSVPFQAVDVFMCKLRPMDKDIEWTPTASRFIHDLVRGKTLEGKVVLRLGYKLWLDPLVMRVHQGESKTIINKFYVHTELIRNGLAIENEDHLKWLHQLCVGKVYIPKVLLIKTRISQMLQTDVLPACREHHQVQVSAVGSPHFFFVQRREKQTDLEMLMKDISDYVEKMDDGVEPPEIAVGAYCLAEYTSYDEKWYRGQVLEVEEDTYDIFFADYGDRDPVPKNRVRMFPKDRFFELPLQAIECQLAHIKPPGPEFEKRAGDIMWDLSHYVNNDLRQMVATVKDKTNSKNAGQNKFVVELHTKTDIEDLDMAAELVWRQLAVPGEGGHVEHLFARPLGLKKRISSCLLIPDLCAAIYWEEDPSKALSTAGEILAILQRSAASLSSAQSKKSASEGLQCLVKLVARIGWGNVHSVLLECLICLARADERFVGHMLAAGVVSSLIHCLGMNSDTKLQHQAADFIAKMANLSTVFRTDFQSFDDNIFVLYELFEYTECEQVKGAVCRAFTAHCVGSERVSQYLMEKSFCVALVKCLNQSADHSVVEAALLLISTLSELHSSHADLKRESLIEAIVKNLQKSECNKCIQHSVQLCDNFAVTRRKHKTFLLELETVPVLTRLLSLELQSTTKQLCKDLKSSLIVKVPSEPLSGTTLRPNSRQTHAPSSSGNAPPVYWSQNSFNVILSVKLNNVPNRKDIVSFGENVIKFSAAVEGVIYSFDCKLYGKIIEASSKVGVRSQEVLISMKKEMKERWPRLLQDKQKPANLSVDYERFVDSSCDSEVDDEEKPFVLKRKKKKPFLGKGPSKSRDKTGEEEQRATDDDTDTDDSLENLRDLDDRNDYDPFRL